MKHLWFFRGLAIACCVLALCSGCRRKRVEGAAPTMPQGPIPSAPLLAQPKVGEPMPAVTTELMLNFEARFGRPPTNYSELSRLKSELPKK